MNFGTDLNSGYTEHLVTLKEKGLLFPKKVGIISLGALLAVGITVLGFTVLSQMATLVPFLLALVGYGVWYLWRFVSVEYEYSLMQGEISFDVIYGRRLRKSYYSTPVKNMEKICPVQKGDAKEGADRTLFCASEKANPRTVWALVREEGGGRTLLYFEMTEKAERLLRQTNARAFFGN